MAGFEFFSPLHKLLWRRQEEAKDGLEDDAIPESENSSFVKEQVDDLVRQLSYLFVVGGTFFLFRRRVNLDLSYTISSMISGWFHSPLKAIGTSVGILLLPSLMDVNLNYATNMRKYYERCRKRRYSPSMQLYVDGVLNEYIRESTLYGGTNRNNFKPLLTEIMKLPVNVKSVEVNQAEFMTFIDDYEPDVQDEITKFVASIIKTSKVRGPLSRKTAPLMLVGAPGTGKTHLVSRLGEMTGLPVVSIQFSKYSGHDGIAGDDCRFNFSNKRGIVADMLLDGAGKTANCANKIVLLDEIDKSICADKKYGGVSYECQGYINFLLHLLEQSTTDLSMKRYETAYWDISHLKFVLIANKTFSESLGVEDAAALENRVKVLRFDRGYDADTKTKIIMKRIGEMAANEDISEDVIDDDVISSIVTRDEAVGSKGVRIALRIAEEYVQFAASVGQLADLSGREVKFNVDKAFQQYEEKKPPISETAEPAFERNLLASEGPFLERMKVGRRRSI